MQKMLLFVSGLGVLGLLLALLLFQGELVRPVEPVTDVSISSFPVSTPAVNVIEEPLPGSLGVGQRAPDFTLLDLQGNPTRLADFQGRPVIINFWATWCAPCRIEMPELQDAFERYAGDGLVILALNREEELETVRQYFDDDLGLTFTALLDRKAEVADSYGVFNMPTTFFVSGAGEITAVHRGPMAAEVIDGYMDLTLR